MIKVQQQDRDAAANWLSTSEQMRTTDPCIAAIRRGAYRIGDYATLPEAFARHAFAARKEGEAQGMEKAAEIAESHADPRCRTGDIDFDDAYEFAASAIANIIREALGLLSDYIRAGGGDEEHEATLSAARAVIREASRHAG